MRCIATEAARRRASKKRFKSGTDGLTDFNLGMPWSS